MAKKYVSRCMVMRNGTKVEHLKSFNCDEVEFAQQIALMDGAGFIDKMPAHGFSVNYVMPKSGAKMDWTDVEDETWVIALKGGGRVTYSGVKFLKRGAWDVDGESETVLPLFFGAETEIIE